MSQATEYKQNKSELAHVNFEDIALQLEQCGFEAEVCWSFVAKRDGNRINTDQDWFAFVSMSKAALTG